MNIDNFAFLLKYLKNNFYFLRLFWHNGIFIWEIGRFADPPCCRARLFFIDRYTFSGARYFYS